MKLRNMTKLMALSVFVSACGGGPTTPPTPTITSIGITGTPSGLTQGQTAQLTATATLSNNTTQNVTSTASWQSSNSAVATVTMGLVTAVGAGSANITATQGVSSAAASITVTAAGGGGGGGGAQTFTLTGTITETNSTVPISDVEIEILNGANAGRTTNSSASGAYSFTQLSLGTFTMRARRQLYNTKDTVVNMTGNQRQDFQMEKSPVVVITATIVGDASVNTDTNVTYHGESSASSAGPIVKWSWNCGQTVAANCAQEGAIPTPIFNYRRCGTPNRPPCSSGTSATYTITLTVTDSRGNMVSSTKNVTVANLY